MPTTRDLRAVAAEAPRACDDCLRRSDLIAALAGRLDIEWRRRTAPSGVLALRDEELLELADAGIRRRWAAFRPEPARALVAGAGLVAACRCSPRYPAALRDLPDPPAVLHVAGRLAALDDPDRVGVVGARAASAYGREVARELGRMLAVAGVPVVSGLALGIDATAHEGAILAGAAGPGVAAAPSSSAAGPSAAAPGTGDASSADVAAPGAAAAPPGTAAAPVAVLAGAADRPYPARGHRLYAAVRRSGAIVSEMPPGFCVYRWAFVARNRIIAALSRVLVVVEAAERSGSLSTADFAAGIGRTVAAIPGRVTARTAAGTNGLIRDGAPLVRGAADVLDLLAEITGIQRVPVPPPSRRPPDLEPAAQRVLDLIEDGRGTLAELARTVEESRVALRVLGELEGRGLVVRGFGGRYERAP
jgi:DNA processing protein